MVSWLLLIYSQFTLIGSLFFVFGLGLGLRPENAGLGLGLETSGLGLGLEASGLGLGLVPPGLVNITAND